MLTSGNLAAVADGLTKPPVYSTRSTSPAPAAGSVAALVAVGGVAAPCSPHAVSPSSTPAARAPRMVMSLGRHRTPIGSTRPVASASVRLVIARCSVDYIGRLTAHLPM